MLGLLIPFCFWADPGTWDWHCALCVFQICPSQGEFSTISCFFTHSNFLSEKWTGRKEELSILLIPGHFQVLFKTQYLNSGWVCTCKWQEGGVFHTVATYGCVGFELTRDTDASHIYGSWNEKTKTRGRNCREPCRSVLSLSVCWHLYGPAGSKPCVPSSQKPSRERSSVHTNVFGLFWWKGFMPGVETCMKSLQKLKGIPLDQALFYNYYLSAAC